MTRREIELGLACCNAAYLYPITRFAIRGTFNIPPLTGSPARGLTRRVPPSANSGFQNVTSSGEATSYDMHVTTFIDWIVW
jgi:hypothetical protein